MEEQLVKKEDTRYVKKHSYFISFELPGLTEETGPATDQGILINKSWKIIKTADVITSESQVEQILGHILIALETDPPIVPVSIDYLGYTITELPKELILYQMGRVGSVSIRDELQKYMEVRHVHYLQNRGEYGTRHDPRFLDRIQTEDTEWRVVSIVRNPVERNISGFFWGLNNFYDGDGTVYSDKMVDAFINNYPHNYTLDWIDNELNPTLNYNVYDVPFRKHTGYTIYDRLSGNKPLFKLLILRTENITRVSVKAFNEFLGLDTEPLGLKNATKARLPIAKPSIEFAKYAVLPAWYLDAMLESKYAKHFYSDQERDELFAYWKNPDIRSLGA